MPKKYPFPIVLKPDRRILGLPITGFSAWAYRDGKWLRSPLQIDEVNRNGEYVLDGGLPFTAKTDDGWLDSNDEVVFSGKSLGEDVTKTELASFKATRMGQHWLIRFCHGDYYYGSLLLAFDYGLQALKPTPAVKLDVEAQEIETALYRYRFNKANPVLLGNVLFKTPEGERPILESSAFRMVFELPWWLPNFTLTEDNFTSSLESWQSGPIRTIVAVGVKLKNFLSLFSFHMFSELVFYEDYFQIPTVLEFPDSPRKFLKPGSGLAYSVGFGEGDGWEVESNIKLLPKSPDRLLEGSERDLSTPYVAYIRGGWGGLALQASVTSDNDTPPPAPYHITKDMFGKSTHSAEWGWLESMQGDLGMFVDISNVDKGSYKFRLDLRLDSKADQGLHEAFAIPKAEWVTLSLP